MATWLFLGPLAVFGLQVWQLFIAWANFYNQGGKSEGLTKTIVCMSFGAFVGMLLVMLAGQLGNRHQTRPGAGLTRSGSRQHVGATRRSWPTAACRVGRHL